MVAGLMDSAVLDATWTGDGRVDLTMMAGASRNAMSSTLVDSLLASLDEAEHRAARMVVLRSCGGVFSGGFDLGGLDEETDATLLLRFTRIGLLLERLSQAPFTSVAVVDGAAVGAGADLALACDHRLASARASFRFPGAGFGVVLGTARLAALIGVPRALDLVSTGRSLTAKEAADLHLVQLVDEDIDDDLGRLYRGVARLPAPTLAGLLLAGRGPQDGSALADLVRSIAGNPGISQRITAFATSLRAQSSINSPSGK